MATATPRKNKAGEIVSYQLKVSRGYDPETGKQLNPYTETYKLPKNWDTWSARSQKKAVQDALNNFESRCKRGEVQTRSERIEAQKTKKKQKDEMPTFQEFAERYLKHSEVKPSTKNIKQGRFKRLNEVWGDTKLDEISSKEVKKYFQGLYDQKVLSYDTLDCYISDMKAIFDYAVEMEILAANPIETMKKLKRKKDDIKKHKEALTPEETEIFIDGLETEPLKWKTIFTLLLDSGMRIGELSALFWTDINFKEGTVTISKSATTTSEGQIIGSTKTGKTRIVYLSDHVLNLLDEWKESDETKVLKSDLVFPSRKDNLMVRATFRYHLKLFCDRMGIKVISPHQLRHTAASLMIANGIDIATVSAKLGHANITTTFNTYVHDNEKTQREATKKFARALYGNRFKKNDCDETPKESNIN